MAEIRILDTRRLLATDPARAGKSDRLVFYSADGGPVRTLRLPDEGLTEDRIKAAVKADLAELGALKGKTFTL